MKRLFILSAILMLAFTSGMAQQISNVEEKGSWIYIYDETGKKINTQSASSVGRVVGWSAMFWISKKSSWYYLWTPKGRKYKTLSESSIGEIIGVSGSTFTSRKNGWIYTFDKEGKKINTRYSN